MATQMGKSAVPGYHPFHWFAYEPACLVAQVTAVPR